MPAKPRAAKTSAERSPFAAVWRVVRRIPRGRVATYGQISAMIDRALAPVGVGWALRAAPDGGVPWQRVVNAAGRVSTDGEHPGLQREMLEAEGVTFQGGAIDLDAFGWRPRASVRGLRRNR